MFLQKSVFIRVGNVFSNLLLSNVVETMHTMASQQWPTEWPSVAIAHLLQGLTCCALIFNPLFRLSGCLSNCSLFLSAQTTLDTQNP